MNEDGDAVQGKKLLGLPSGHPCAQASSGKYREYLHNW
jgi:hypothetical protein